MRSLPRQEHVTSSFIRLHWLPIKFRINFKIAMLYFKCIHGPSIKKAWSPSRRLRHTTSARAPVSSWKTIHDDRKKRLAIEPLPIHPPRFGTVSRNHYSHSKILTPLSHCLKLTILEKRLIYDFFLVFHIVCILTLHCKFKIVHRYHSNFGFSFNM